MRRHIVERGDTLGKIAGNYYGDAGLFKRLAEYNGIINHDIVYRGQMIRIPSRNELLGTIPMKKIIDLGIRPPHGLENIITTFGNIWEHISADGTLRPSWEANHFGRVKLPFAIPLSWKPELNVRNLYCHKKLKKAFLTVFTEVENKGLRNMIKTFGGCFSYRSKRIGEKLSTHSWGIAIDINPESNRMGERGDLDPRVVEIFKRYGFSWGGEWSGSIKDPMHFQYCTGY